MNCPECGAPMTLKHSNKFNRKFYGCTRWPECKGTHGAHSDGTPLGIPADKETKEWRIKAHASFDNLWKQGLMTRRGAYLWLQKAMGLKKDEAHIGRFTKEQCQDLIKRCGEG